MDNGKDFSIVLRSFFQMNYESTFDGWIVDPFQYIYDVCLVRAFEIC